MKRQCDDGLAAALHDDLVRHASFGDKISGGAGDVATANWIAGRLARAGYQLERQSVDVPHFEPGECCLHAGDDTAPLYAQAPICTTPASGIEAPLAVVRAPYEATDVAGRIVLVVPPHARHASLASPLIGPLVEAARRGGARALVIVPTGPTGDVVALNAALGTSGTALPLAVLAPAHADPFLRAERDGLQARLVLSGTLERRTTHNLLGRLHRGPRWLCLSTPRTGWFTCATERGTGTAALLALADWTARRFPELSIFIANTGAHEYQFAGAERAMAHAPRPSETLVWVHLGAALAARGRFEFRGRTIALPSADANRLSMATAELQSAAIASFAGLPGLERVVEPVRGISELGTIVEHGYARAYAAIGMPEHFHTRLDNSDEVDGTLLAPVVQAHMRLIETALKDQRVRVTA